MLAKNNKIKSLLLWIQSSVEMVFHVPKWSFTLQARVLKAIHSFDFTLVEVLIDRVDDPSVNHVVMWASSFKIYYSIIMIMIKRQ